MKINPTNPMKRKIRKQKVNLQDVVKAAHKAGAKVSVSLDPKRMPLRLPGDPEPVTLLLEESERMNALGKRWQNAKNPNPMVVGLCFQQGYAYALSGAWLRCKLKGELGKK